MKEHNSTMR